MHPSRAARRTIVGLAVLGVATALSGTLSATLGAQLPTLAALRDAEDARAQTPAQLGVLRAGLTARSSAVRRTAARAIGRLERAALIPDLGMALSDQSPYVRYAAARALILASKHGGAPEARSALLARLAIERDDSVIGALTESLGWIAHADTTQVRATAETLVAHSRLSSGTDTRSTVLRGVAHGLYGLARQPVARKGLPPAAVARLGELVTYHRTVSGPRTDVEIRVLATMAISAGEHAAESLLASALADREPSVREWTMRAVFDGTLTDSVAAERLARRAMADAAPSVRSLAVAAFARRFGVRRGCSPYVAAIADRVLMVRLQGVDALSAGCEPGSPAVQLLDSLVLTLPTPRGNDAGAWHLPAHALVSLAVLAPARARTRLPAFAANPDFFVRDYAARAAVQSLDSAMLRRLAADGHPNVRTSAIAGLSSVEGHAADEVYLAALDATDSQLLQTAAAALAASRDRRAVPALLVALHRISATRSETARDARVALLERIAELGDSTHAQQLRPYLADFDTLLAGRSADLIGKWTGRRPTPAPVPLTRAVMPSARELAALARARVVLTMGDGATIVVRLFPFDAPTSAARFARLARSASFDGLTIHRIVAAQLVQGGSSGANEFAGWSAYTRDELGVPNRRGTIGVSTRGRDTGDGQFYICTGDQFRLDNNYTIFGAVIAGMEAVDRMQEGALIRRARVIQ